MNNQPDLLIRFREELTEKIENFEDAPMNSVYAGVLMGLEEARDLLCNLMDEANEQPTCKATLTISA